MIEKADLQRLEAITGHHFKNEERLKRALTHSSAQNAIGGNYERLEFLGDRVLGLLIAEMLCRFFPNASEGELSVRLNNLVNAEACAEIAHEIGLPDFIEVGRDMKYLDESRLNNVYADVTEALIASIYLDGGLDAARSFINRYWEKRTQNSENMRRDAKTELQEWAHQQNGAQPVYRVVKRKGPDHEPSFVVDVRISGFQPSIGEGRSKRLAERAAAETMLIREGVWSDRTGSE